MDAHQVIDPLVERGFDVFVSVPCSILGSLLDHVADDPSLDHIGAANEGDAVAVAAGAWLAGRKPVVMIQNSGLGNAVNPLTSLCDTFAIPLLMIISWRGRPGTRDAPQHRRMGAMTPALLGEMGIAHEVLNPEGDGIEDQLEGLIEQVSDRRIAALLIPRGAFPKSTGHRASGRSAVPTCHAPLTPSSSAVPTTSPRPSRGEALETLLAGLSGHEAVLSTTGKCSRELFNLADRANHFYQVGSMGCVGALGFAVARWSPHPTVVIDGDGALLMRLGVLATVGAYQPKSLIHVLLDNGVHDSTGGQPTVSPCIDLCAMAAAAGYRAERCLGLGAFQSALRNALDQPGPHFLYVATAPGSPPDLLRPTLPLPELADRFRGFLSAPASATTPDLLPGQIP